MIGRKIKGRTIGKTTRRGITEWITTKITMLTIKEAAALVEGLTEYRVRQMCINNQIPHIMAGKKYLINRDKFLSYLRGETV